MKFEAHRFSRRTYRHLWGPGFDYQGQCKKYKKVWLFHNCWFSELLESNEKKYFLKTFLNSIGWSRLLSVFESFRGEQTKQGRSSIDCNRHYLLLPTGFKLHKPHSSSHVSNYVYIRYIYINRCLSWIWCHKAELPLSDCHRSGRILFELHRLFFVTGSVTENNLCNSWRTLREKPMLPDW